MVTIFERLKQYISAYTRHHLLKTDLRMITTLTLEFSMKTGKQPEFLNLLNDALVATRAFDGCIKVDTFAETDGTSVFLLEQWETRKQQETYSQWRLDNGLMELIEPYLSGPPVRKYYEAIDG